jgi:hypothetical protein
MLRRAAIGTCRLHSAGYTVNGINRSRFCSEFFQLLDQFFRLFLNPFRCPRTLAFACMHQVVAQVT